jgi:hypothetical protein
MIKHGAKQNAVLNLAGRSSRGMFKRSFEFGIACHSKSTRRAVPPDQFMKSGIPEQEAYDLYNRLVGEVVARNAQKRLDWGDIIRSLRRPAATEDVPRHRQINLYDE